MGRVQVYELQLQGRGTDVLWKPMGDPIRGEGNKERAGYTIDLSQDGSVVAVGATDAEAQKGHTRVYKYIVDGSDGRWGKLGQDLKGYQSGDKSGWAVALSSDGMIVAVGSKTNNLGGFAAGRLRVFYFESADSNWTQIGDDIYGEARGDNFGRFLSLSSDGKTVAGTAWLNDGNGQDSGHVRVFSFNDQDKEWHQVGDNINGDGPFDTLSQVSLSGDGRRVATSTGDGDEGVGYVRVYDNIEGSWQLVGGKITGHPAERFGKSLSLSPEGTRLLGGSEGRNIIGDSGLVRLFELQ